MDSVESITVGRDTSGMSTSDMGLFGILMSYKDSNVQENSCKLFKELIVQQLYNIKLC